jgi:hypothetical protein
MVRRLAFAAALAVIAAAFSSAAAASAATDQFTVVSAGSPAAHVGDLTVVLDSTEPITAVTAGLTSTSQAAVDMALSETGSAQDGPTGITSTWSVPTPITVSQLPLGTYQISLAVTFQDQSVQTDADAGDLAFLDEPQITLNADPAETGYDYSPTINVSGNVAVLAPDGSTAPYAGSLLLSTDGAAVGQSLTTDSSGDFTAQLVDDSGATFIQLAIGTPDGNAPLAAGTDRVALTPVIDPQRITAKLAQPTIRYGADDEITGTLSYLPFDTGSTYQPLGGQTIQVYNSIYSKFIYGTTNANGDFTIKLTDPVPAIYRWLSSTWTVVAKSDPGQFDSAQVVLPMTVQIPTAVTRFHVTLNRYWQLNYSGCLTLWYQVPDEFTDFEPVLQYAAGPNGPWHLLASKLPRSGACGFGNLWFSGSVIAPRNYAYYRVYYPGNTTTRGVYLASASASALEWKYEDQIAGLSVSPHVVGKNGRLTVKGRLEYYDSGWRALPKQTVYIVFRQKGASTWYWIVTAKTNASGYFAATVKDSVGSATWSAEFEGDGTHLATSPPGIYVRVSG